MAHHGVFRTAWPTSIPVGDRLLRDQPRTQRPAKRLQHWSSSVALVVLMVWTLMRSADGLVTNAVGQIYDGLPMAKDRPIRGFLQLFKIFMYVLGAILISGHR